MTVEAVFFDLFGTLLPLGPLDDACEQLARGRGREIAARWRARQIEATWLRTVMGRWVDFDVVTVDALRATLEELGIPGDQEAVLATAGAFASLPAHAGAEDVVRELHSAGVAVGILTNASKRTLDSVVGRLGFSVDHALSVDAVERYKPDPAVYALAVEASGASVDRIGFVTANGWDAAGASGFGFRVAWLAAGAGVPPAVGAPPPLRLTWPEVPSAFLERPALAAR